MHRQPYSLGIALFLRNSFGWARAMRHICCRTTRPVVSINLGFAKRFQFAAYDVSTTFESCAGHLCVVGGLAFANGGTQPARHLSVWEAAFHQPFVSGPSSSHLDSCCHFIPVQESNCTSGFVLFALLHLQHGRRSICRGTALHTDCILGRLGKGRKGKHSVTPTLAPWCFKAFGITWVHIDVRIRQPDATLLLWGP